MSGWVGGLAGTHDYIHYKSSFSCKSSEFYLGGVFLASVAFGGRRIWKISKYICRAISDGGYGIDLHSPPGTSFTA